MTSTKNSPFPTFSVVIVSWNVSHELSMCLKSILATKYPLQIIVIDNASDDNSLAVANSYSSVTVISNPINIGFPAAVNIGLKKCTSDYILLLNPDTQIPKDFFTKSIEFFSSHPDAGVMGPLFLNPDNSTQGSVFPEPSLINTFREFWLGETGLTSKYTPLSQDSQPIAVSAISGGCMVLPKETVSRVGLFTQEVFMYYEDLDYCRRIRGMDKKVYFNPNISIIHEHGSSAKKSSQASDWRGYLTTSSIWYNGPVKHYLLWFIAWSGQKFNSIFHAKPSDNT